MTSPSVALDVRDLDVIIDPRGRRLHVLRGISLSLAAGEVLGVIGESGSGKTMMGMSLLRLEPAGAALTAEAMRVSDVDLLRADAIGLQAVRGRLIGMIFQDPVGAFNPAKRIGWHAEQVLRRREKGPWRERAVAMLADVDIADGARVLAAYPHQLSGGMLQRVLIALVLAAGPAVVVADEPTTNLDNIVEQQILALFRRFRGEGAHGGGAAFIFITHDMSVAAGLCDRIAVMYAGEIVEMGDAEGVFADPKHPYTRALIATSRALQGEAVRLPELAGEPPGLAGARTGCAFASRCGRRMAACTQGAVAMRRVEGRDVRCINYG
jgi:oligopeptide/dipeptide ABC transporter ATP-binding protein